MLGSFADETMRGWTAVTLVLVLLALTVSVVFQLVANR